MFDSNLDEIIDILANVSKFQGTENLQRTTGNNGLARIWELRKLSLIEKLKTSIFLSILEGEFYLTDCKNLLEKIKLEITTIKNTSNRPIVLLPIEEMLADYSYLNEYVLDRSSNSFQKKYLISK